MVSSHTLSRIAHKLKLDEGKLANIKKKGEEATGKVLNLALTSAGCAAFSYANGFYGGQNVDPDANVSTFEWQKGNMPVDAAAGVLLFGAGLLNFGGKFSEPLASLGNGAIQSFVARKATLYGLKRRHEADTHASAGYSPAQVQQFAQGSGAPWGYARARAPQAAYG